ncbi:protein spdB, partial [Streptomyces sp. PDY-4]
AARQGDGTARALTCVTERVTPGVTDVTAARWELPVWGPSEAVPAIEAAPALTDEELDVIVGKLGQGGPSPVTYRAMAEAFRAAGHSAGETRLRASWRRVSGQAGEAA